MVVSCDQQIRGWNYTCNSLRSKVHRLADHSAQMGLDYQEMDHEQFLAEVPEFAEKEERPISLNVVGLSLSWHHIPTIQGQKGKENDSERWK
ncbi:hypothetical protein RDI58_013550 [Solanum bulbocastanum]|uniref:Uncharacterized protein n=1 Tax=Solanum bulbocastanum TaxID=147425 RepID=A0AAN8TMF0_SOLBU